MSVPVPLCPLHRRLRRRRKVYDRLWGGTRDTGPESEGGEAEDDGSYRLFQQLLHIHLVTPLLRLSGSRARLGQNMPRTRMRRGFERRFQHTDRR